MNRAERRKDWNHYKNSLSGLTWWQKYDIQHPLASDVRQSRMKKRLGLETE